LLRLGSRGHSHIAPQHVHIKKPPNISVDPLNIPYDQVSICVAPISGVCFVSAWTISACWAHPTGNLKINLPQKQQGKSWQRFGTPISLYKFHWKRTIAHCLIHAFNPLLFTEKNLNVHPWSDTPANQKWTTLGLKVGLKVGLIHIIWEFSSPNKTKMSIGIVNHFISSWMNESYATHDPHHPGQHLYWLTLKNLYYGSRLKTNWSFRTAPTEGCKTMHAVCKMEESVFACEKCLQLHGFMDYIDWLGLMLWVFSVEKCLINQVTVKYYYLTSSPPKGTKSVLT